MGVQKNIYILCRTVINKYGIEQKKISLYYIVHLHTIRLFYKHMQY